MKGLLFTYLMTYGGAMVALFNPFVGLLIYASFSILRPPSLWPWAVPPASYSQVVAMGMLAGWVAVPGAEVVAVCDIRADRATRAADTVAAAGKARPAEYGSTTRSFQQMLNREQLDLVYVATPWEWHFRQGMAALRNGKHVGIELPIATELKELWQLVDASERARRHCFLMENCSYGRNELAILRMAHDGLFGELTNGHGGYLHEPSGRFLWYTDGMQYMNHRPVPDANIGLGYWPDLDKDHTIALRDIAAGEELFEDYTFWSDGGLSPDHWLYRLYRKHCPEHLAFLQTLTVSREAA